MDPQLKSCKKIPTALIAIMVVAGLLLASVPQPARAMDGGAGLTLVAKEFGADLIARLIVARLIRKMTNTTVKWIQGGENPGQNVGYVGNFGDDLKKELNRAGGEAINQLGGINFCDARLQKNINFSLRLPPNGIRQQLGCDVTTIIGNTKFNYKKLQTDFEGGWPAFINYSMRPQNNPNGSFLIALDMSMQVQSTKAEGFKEGYQAGGGILGVQSTKDSCILVENKKKTQAEVDVIMYSGAEGDSPDFSLDTYDKYGKGVGAVYVPKGAKKMTQAGKDWIPDAINGKWAICHEVKTTKTPGRAVADMLAKTANIGYDFSVVADELNEAITSVATALMNKVIGSAEGLFDKETGTLTAESFKGGEQYKQLEWGVNKAKAAEQVIADKQSDRAIYAGCIDGNANTCKEELKKSYDKLGDTFNNLVTTISPKLEQTIRNVSREFMFLNSAQLLSNEEVDVIKKLANRKSLVEEDKLSANEKVLVEDMLKKSDVTALTPDTPSYIWNVARWDINAGVMPKLPYIRSVKESNKSVLEIVSFLYSGKTFNELTVQDSKDVQEFIKVAGLDENDINDKLDGLAKRGASSAKDSLKSLVDIIKDLEDNFKIVVPDLPAVELAMNCNLDVNPLQLQLLTEIMRMDRAIGVSADGTAVDGIDKLGVDILRDISPLLRKNTLDKNDSDILDVHTATFVVAAAQKEKLISFRKTLLADLSVLTSSHCRREVDSANRDYGNLSAQADQVINNTDLAAVMTAQYKTGDPNTPKLPINASAYQTANTPATIKDGLVKIGNWVDVYEAAASEKMHEVSSGIPVDSNNFVKFNDERIKLDDLAREIGRIQSTVRLSASLKDFEAQPGEVISGLRALGDKSVELDSGIIELIRMIKDTKKTQ